MNSEKLRSILKKVKDHELSTEDALSVLKDFSFQDLEYAKIDHHRELRTGYPEIIFCQGKTIEQIRGIIEAMLENGSDVVGTRADKEIFDSIKDLDPAFVYHEKARIFYSKKKKSKIPETRICVITEFV